MGREDARQAGARDCGDGETLTYAALDDHTPQTYEVYWAALRSGLYITAVNHNLSADEAAYIVNDCGASALVVSAASLHPKVTDIAVIGLPDEEMGERVVGVVQAAPGVAAGRELEQELIDYALERIARYKVPREIHFVEELPRAPTGKLVKGKLRSQFTAG